MISEGLHHVTLRERWLRDRHLHRTQVQVRVSYGQLTAHYALAMAHKMSSQETYYDGLRRVSCDEQFPVRNFAIIQNVFYLTRSFP